MARLTPNVATVYLTVDATPEATDDYYGTGEGETLAVINTTPYVVGWTDTDATAGRSITR